MSDDFTGSGDVALVEILSCILTGDFHGQLDLGIDVDAVKDTFPEGELTRKLDGITCKDEALSNIAGKGLAEVVKDRGDHEVVDFVCAEVKLNAIAVAPNLDVSPRHT